MSTDDDDILAIAREGFLEEARDMLRQFEQALLAMEAEPGDAEATNTAFRAAHTIKGTAGMFGFDAVVAFTHEVESLLEAMRSGRLATSDASMALLLQGRDQMERLVDVVHLGPTASVDEAELAATSAALGQALRALHADEATAPCVPTSVAPAEAPAAVAGVWHLSLRMGDDALRNGLDPLSFIRYLDTVGRVVGIRTVASRLPSLDTLEPENCHLDFEIRLQTAAARTTIEEVFEFLADDCDLRLLAPDATSADYESLLDARASLPAERATLLAHWQHLAGPDAPPFIERRQLEAVGRDRRTREPERRAGSADRRAPEETRFVRVRADKLDALIDLIGELVIAGSAAQLVAQQEHSPRFAEAALRIHDLVQSARDGALGLRMVPIGETFARFQRVVRDVSKQLGKDVALQISGGETELDKSMVETIADPLMHLVRNSLDHGLETPAERLEAGKPAAGQLGLHAYHEAGAVVIEVSDDGRGLDRDRIHAKAVERQLVSADSVLTDEEVYALIFRPGFSTAEQVTNLSGRGVGMDVVKRNVEALRGQIKVASTPGRGSTMQVRLPLTLAIIDGFLTQVAGVSYLLPLDTVAECIELPAASTTREGATCGCVDLRGEVLPYIDMRQLFGHPGPPPARRSLIVVKAGAGRLALVVDRLHGEYQAVIKPLGAIFRDVQGIAGSTILGSGEVALILDVAALEQQAVGREAAFIPSHVANGRAAPAAQSSIPAL